ncbi:hypothetical protein ACLOJK_022547 [Asimina triloba]
MTSVFKLSKQASPPAASSTDQASIIKSRAEANQIVKFDPASGLHQQQHVLHQVTTTIGSIPDPDLGRSSGPQTIKSTSMEQRLRQ